MPFPEIKTRDLINSLRMVYTDALAQEAANRLEMFAKELERFERDWHQPELCNEKYNALVLECNAWEELCDEMYDHYDTPPKIENKYLELKNHYVK
jgi:hypothetical protein